MKFTQAILPFVFSAAAVAVPTATIEKRAAICGQWDSVVTGTYTVYQDLWNEASATSGSQCTTVNSLSGTTVAWSTSWTWAGGSNQVKSYANAVVKATVKQISAISSIPSTWKWRYVSISRGIENIANWKKVTPDPTSSQMFPTTCSPPHLPPEQTSTKS
jgi:xyloglucan-specific endo-beta-1,4-glucanase